MRNYSLKSQILPYITDQEDQENEKSNGPSSKESPPSTEVASESSDTNSDDETENNDITKFLGLAKSPVVQQALQSLGLPGEGEAASTQQKRSNRSRKSKGTEKPSAKNTSSTPTKRVLSEPPTKVRLTYENATTENEKAKEKIPFPSPLKKLKLEQLPAASQEEKKVKQEEIKVEEVTEDSKQKVPPLKIVLANKKAQDAENDTSFNFEYYMKKRKLRPPQTAVVRPLRPPSPPIKVIQQPIEEQPEPVVEIEETTVVKKPLKKVPLNDIEKYQRIRKQIEVKRKNLFPVYPKPPEGFKDYLMNKKTYLLQENAQERLRSMPLIQPPGSLRGPLRLLFVEQEKERFKLRTKHLVEKEKLVLAVEQVRSSCKKLTTYKSNEKTV